MLDGLKRPKKTHIGADSPSRLAHPAHVREASIWEEFSWTERTLLSMTSRRRCPDTRCVGLCGWPGHPVEESLIKYTEFLVPKRV